MSVKVKRSTIFGVRRDCSTIGGRAANRGVVTFISGGALGVDQWAAEIVIEVRSERQKRSPQKIGGIQLVIARPFPSQPNRWPMEARRHYEKILQKADRIIETSDDPYAAWKLQKRNEWMVDNSGAIIAVPSVLSSMV